MLVVLDSRIDVETKYLDFENRDVVILASLSPDTNSQIVEAPHCLNFVLPIKAS